MIPRNLPLVLMLLGVLFSLAVSAASGKGAPRPEVNGNYAMPTGIDDPDAAIADWTFSDPVYMWRLLNRPEDPFEPPAYFYWPDALIVGDLKPFFPLASQPAISPQALDDMGQWAQSHKSNVLIVVHRGEVVLEQYWNGVSPDTLVNGRAMTRSMAPLLLGFAVRDGGVSLDDPIGRYIQSWEQDPRGAITVRQLAQNVSGLQLPERLPATQVLGNGFMCLSYCGDVNRAALAFPLIDEPGRVFNVADQNMQILAMVIESAMAQPIEEILSERVWKKIGASDATFQRDRPGGKARVMCCMRATARDWARLGVLVMRDGNWQGQQILPAGWIATMANPSPVNSNHGIGLWLGTPYDPLRTYYSGQPGVIPMSEPFLADDVRIIEGGGFRVLYMSPSHDLVIFRHGVGVPDWDGAALVNIALRGMKKQN